MLDWIHAGPSIAAAFRRLDGRSRGSDDDSPRRGNCARLALRAAGRRRRASPPGRHRASLRPSDRAGPHRILHLVIGALLLLFGMRWLRKAILRYAGVIALHDEDATFARETKQMRDVAPRRSRAWDPIAVATTFKAVMLEGIEVVVIVLGVGAVGGMLIPASIGALAACLLVTIVGAMLHRPLSRVPENALKFTVGILISAFGMYWFTAKASASPGPITTQPSWALPRCCLLWCRARRSLTMRAENPFRQTN